MQRTLSPFFKLMVCMSVLWLMPGVGGATEAFQLPPKGSRFLYRVEAKGDSPALMGLWAKKGGYQEAFTNLGVIKGFRPKLHNGKDVEPALECVHFRVEIMPGGPVSDHYYTVQKDAFGVFFRRLSLGDIKLYVSPIKLFPLSPQLGQEDVSKTDYYIYAKDTGVPIFRTYESPNLHRDRLVSKMKVLSKETVTTNAGTFDCFVTRTEHEATTGSFPRKANSRVFIKQWWAPKLGWFVKEESHIEVRGGLIKFDGDIHRELTRYHTPKSGG